MDDKLNDLLIILDSEIDKKCYELKMKEQDLKNTRLFVLTCALFIMIPILLAFAGVNILGVFFPIVLFLAFSMAVLSPIVLNNDLGGATNERF